MKSLFTLILCLFVSVLFSQIQLEKKYGSFPIIISAGHGGTERTFAIRDCDSHNCSADLFTNELAKDITSELSKLKVDNYLITNNVHRSRLDLNRESGVAFTDRNAAKIYYDYHTWIANSIVENIYSDSAILYVDVHGHSGREIYFGYDISKEDLLNDVENQSYGVLKASDAVYFMGDILTYLGYETWPRSNDNDSQRYYNGGYSVEQYKVFPNTYVLQIEVPSKLRKNKFNRQKLAEHLAISIYHFYNHLNKKHEKFIR